MEQTLNRALATSLKTDSPTHLLRAKIAESRTTLLGDDVFDSVTAEYYGTYLKIPFSREPDEYKQSIPSAFKVYSHIAEDGSPLPPDDDITDANSLGSIIELCLPQPIDQTQQPTKLGRRPQVIDNPFSAALCIIKHEQRNASWLDDVALGAVHTGPGVINGKHSVALADVKRLLLMPELSVATAAHCLFNHDRQPMSTRQLQRVVEAARVALGGIALYLERNPEILRAIDTTVDFNEYWGANDQQPIPASVSEHTMRQEALALVDLGTPIKVVARTLELSKNTVKKWHNQRLTTDLCKGSIISH